MPPMNSQLTNVPSRPLSIQQEEYDVAMEQLHQVDPRIPGDVLKKAGPTVLQHQPTSFRTTIFPPAMSVNFPIPTCLHSSCRCQTSVGSRCHLPLANNTITPGHFVTARPSKTAQLILLEGKIRPANWSYHKNPQRCHLPTFGAFYIGREVSNADKTIPAWAETDLLDSMEKKGKGQQDVTVGAMYRGSEEHIAFKAGGNEKAQLGVGDKGIVNTS